MSEKDAIEDLRDRGFLVSFTASGDRLRCEETQEEFAPEDCRIIETHRFEGCTNVSDEAIVLGIETATGLRGVMMDAYGPYASPTTGAVLARMPVARPVATDRD